MPRRELAEEQWKRIEPLLPPQGRMGRPRVDDRKVVEGILYVLRTGCRWQDMPREYGAYVTAWRRGCGKGSGRLCWGPWTKTGRSSGRECSSTGASSERKGGDEVGLTKVGKGTKRMLVTDGNGTPLGLVLSRADPAEIRLAVATLERVRVPRRRGRPRKRPQHLIADKGYDCDEFRTWLRRKGLIPRIPPGKNRTGRRKTWDEEYRERWHIERTFAWVGNFRRLLVRHERLISVYAAFFTVACILISLRTIEK